MLYWVEIWEWLGTNIDKIRVNGNQQEYASIHLENGSWMQRNGSRTVENSSEVYKRSNENVRQQMAKKVPERRN